MNKNFAKSPTTPHRDKHNSGFKTSQNVIYNIISTKLTMLLNKGEGMTSLCSFGNHCVKGFKANIALFQRDFFKIFCRIHPSGGCSCGCSCGSSEGHSDTLSELLLKLLYPTVLHDAPVTLQGPGLVTPTRTRPAGARDRLTHHAFVSDLTGP